MGHLLAGYVQNVFCLGGFGKDFCSKTYSYLGLLWIWAGYSKPLVVSKVVKDTQIFRSYLVLFNVRTESLGVDKSYLPQIAILSRIYFLNYHKKAL